MHALAWNLWVAEAEKNALLWKHQTQDPDALCLLILSSLFLFLLILMWKNIFIEHDPGISAAYWNKKDGRTTSPE